MVEPEVGSAEDDTRPSHDDPQLGWDALANDPDAWLAQSRLPEHERSPWYDRGRYPRSGSVRDFYLNPSNKLTPQTLRDVLRALLPDGSGMVGSDYRVLEFSLDKIAAHLKDGEASEYERRLVRAALGDALAERTGRSPKGRPAAPIPDMTWLIDLAFHHPAQAFEVAHSFLSVHFWVLNDQVIDGIFDFMATVRCHFRLESSDDADALLIRSLSPRDLEYLVAALWGRIGYVTEITKATRDGGKDVIAKRDAPGQQEVVLIECRQWSKKISVKAIREMIGVMQDERANKGVVVAPGGFSQGTGSATEYAARLRTVELVDGARLATIMTERFGPRWPIEIDRHIQAGRRISDSTDRHQT